MAPAIVAPMFRTSRAPSSSGRCQKEANALKTSFEGPERLQEDTKRRSVPNLHLRFLKCLVVSQNPVSKMYLITHNVVRAAMRTHSGYC